MNYTVSYTDFRKNMSDYADLVLGGKEITVNNEKKGVALFKVIKADEGVFDWKDYMKFIRKIGGSGLLVSKKDDEARNRFRNSFNKRFKKAYKR